MLTICEGHWYRGRSGRLRRIGYISGVDVWYAKDNEFDGKCCSVTTVCCIATFKRWAVEDLGTEEPKGDM
jgi:hypothetical protein